MSKLADVLHRTRTMTFDCYGTLVDWRMGMTRSFGEIFGDLAGDRMAELFHAYFELEMEVEAEAYRPYREVLITTVRRVARRLDLPLEPDRAELLPRALPDWPLFADTNAALVALKKRYRLGVLSNIDRDLFSGTARHFDVAFDFVVTAEDVRSYKPGHAHFERTMAEHAEGETTLHVAQSLYHDGVPAQQLGLAYVWINRYAGSNETQVVPVAEFADLRSLAEAARL